MKEIKYFCITENNSWEGEKWNYLMPASTKKELENIEEIKQVLNDLDDGREFEFSYRKELIDKTKAEQLVEDSEDDAGYMPRWQFVKNKRIMRKIVNLIRQGDKDEALDLFAYKYNKGYAWRKA